MIREMIQVLRKANPSRDYLWILSRTPHMDAATYDAILERLAAQGYDTSRLLRTDWRFRPGAAGEGRQ